MVAETTPKPAPRRRKKAKKTAGGTAPAQAQSTAERKTESKTERKATHQFTDAGKPIRSPTITTVIVAIVVIGVASAAGYLWRNAQIESDKQLAEISARIGEAEQRFDSFAANQENLGAPLEQLRERLNAAEDGLNEGGEKIAALTDSLAELQDEVGGVGDLSDWNLREIERLLIIANQRLLLSDDTGLAADMLTIADGRLRRLSDPALDPVREIIAFEIAALSDVAAVDVAGTLNALSALARSVDGLPFAGDPDDEPAKSSTEQSAGDSSLLSAGKNFIKDLGALVQVETDGKPSAPLLSAELRRIIVEKTGLILESCQLAFLREQAEIYAARMTEAKNWVTANFDTDSAEVGAWLERWAALAALSPQTKTPDISGSLRALREALSTEN